MLISVCAFRMYVFVCVIADRNDVSLPSLSCVFPRPVCLQLMKTKIAFESVEGGRSVRELSAPLQMIPKRVRTSSLPTS